MQFYAGNVQNNAEWNIATQIHIAGLYIGDYMAYSIWEDSDRQI